MGIAAARLLEYLEIRNCPSFVCFPTGIWKMCEFGVPISSHAEPLIRSKFMYTEVSRSEVLSGGRFESQLHITSD